MLLIRVCLIRKYTHGGWRSAATSEYTQCPAHIKVTTGFFLLPPALITIPPTAFSPSYVPMDGWLSNLFPLYFSGSLIALKWSTLSLIERCVCAGTTNRVPLCFYKAPQTITRRWLHCNEKGFLKLCAETFLVKRLWNSLQRREKKSLESVWVANQPYRSLYCAHIYYMMCCKQW